MRKVNMLGGMHRKGREHLDIHEIVHTDAPKFRKLLSALL
jgi:hypothetical protein